MNKLHDAWVNATGSKAPATISIEPTIRCNMRCPMCDRTHKPDYKRHLAGELPTETWIDNIRLFGQMGVRQVLIIGGGEPLMRKDIASIVRTIKESGMLCHLWTNGTLMDDAIAPEIVPYLDILTISLDSCFEEEHDKSRGVKGSFAHIQHALSLIKRYRNNHLLLRFHSVISKLNIDRMEDMVDFAVRNGAGELGCAVINPYDFAPKSMLFTQDEMPRVNEILDSVKKKAIAHNIALAGGYNPIFDNDLKEYTQKYNLSSDCKNPTTCFGLWSMSQIRPNGDVSICCFTYKPVIGNLHDNNFKDIWNSETARNMRLKVKQGLYLDKSCVGCTLGRAELTDMVERCPDADEMLNRLVLRSR